MLRSWIALAALVSSAMPLAARAEIAPAYSVTAIAPSVSPTALNDLGQVVGTTWEGVGTTPSPWLYTPGVGVQALPGVTGRPAAINNAGQVAGDNGSAYLYTPGAGVSPVPAPVPNTFSAAYALNNIGAAAGTYRANATYNHAFVYTPGQGSVDIHGAAGGGSDATAINDAGVVVGHMSTETGASRAFVYTSATGMTDVGAGWLWDVNDNGLAAGTFGTGLADSVAVLFDTTTGMVTPLPFGPGWNRSGASALNDAGQAVGTAFNVADDWYRGFLYDPQAGVVGIASLVDPALQMTFSEALDINNRGQILVMGWTATDTRPTAFLLTPVPEPGTLALLAAGLLALAALRVRASGSARGCSPRCP